MTPMKYLKFFLLAVFLVSAPKLSFSKEIFSFEGNIDFLNDKFHIVLDLDERSSVAVRAQRISDKGYHFSLDIEHLKTPFFDLLSKIESSIEFVGEEKRCRIQ